MAETQDGNERRDLYRLLLNDPATRKNTAQYSFKQWESKLLGDEENIKRVADYATKKNWVLDQEDFLYKYAPEKVARTPKPQAAPKQQAVAPVAIEEEEAYVPEPQPLVGSPEYTDMLDGQYGDMKPTLGATFAGTPASFETKEQKKQEQISPAFKAQQLAFEDVPIAEEQRRSQREFAKATKEQQRAALTGATGTELKKAKESEKQTFGERTGANVEAFWEGTKNAAVNIYAGLKNAMNVAALNETPMDDDERDYYVQKEFQNMYDLSKKAETNLQDELYRLNVSTDVLDAIDKGQYSKIPEAVLQTVGNVGVSMAASILSAGGSMYFQTLPDIYRDNVEAIAREKGITPEEVIQSGDDAKTTAQLASAVSAALERMGAGLVSKSMASKGGYAAFRNYLLRKGFGRIPASGAALGFGAGGEGVTEHLQQTTQQLSRIAAASENMDQFLKKLPKELLNDRARKERMSALVGGLIGGGAMIGGGQLYRGIRGGTPYLFEKAKIGKVTERPDYQISQTDDKIQQRNKMLQAMESAIQANPEAEGQIRERYRKLTDALELTDQEVLDAYDGTAQLPPSPERDRIIQGLEEYMAEKGIQPQATGVEAGLGEGLRTVAPEETITAPPIITQPPVEPVEPITTEEETTEAPAEEPSLEESLLGIVPQEPVTEEAPVEEVAPEEEVVAEEAPLSKEQTRVKALLNDIYFNVPGGKNGQILDDGFSNSFEALDRANKVGGNQYSAHGMGKSSVGSAFTDLYTLLTKGIDPSRGGGRLYTAPLSGGQKGAGAGIGTATGNAYMDGPFTIVANKGVGSITDVSEIGGIIVNDGIVNAKPEILDALREAFPNIIFESTSNTDKLVEQLNQKAEQQVAPSEEVVAEEVPQPKAGDFVIVNGEKGVVVVTPGGQMSVETDTKIYDLDERGIAGIGGRLVAPKEKTQTEYEVEVIDDDNALVNGEPFQIIRDEKGNTIALQGQTRTIRTEPVMVDVDIKRNKAQVKETPQQQAEEVESLSPDMTLDKQKFVDDIIGQNMTEGVDRILSDGVTEKTQERDLLQFKLFVEATIADLRARQKGNPYADAMIEQLQEALNTVYYEYYSQGRKAEARTSKTEKKTNRGTKGKERVAPKPAEGKQPVAKQPEAPKPAPVAPPAAPKAQPVAEKKPSNIGELSEQDLFDIGFTRKESKAIAQKETKINTDRATLSKIKLSNLAEKLGKTKEQLIKSLSSKGYDEVDLNEQWERQNSKEEPKFFIRVNGEFSNKDPQELGSFHTEAAAKRGFEVADERQDGSEDQENNIELIKETEDGFDVISQKSIPAINDATREILADVQREFGGKYTNIELPNGKILNIRIADHSGNKRNNSGDRNLSVVISNLNPTERFRGEIDKAIPNEIVVNSELTADQIVAQINKAIDKIKAQEGGKQEPAQEAPVTPPAAPKVEPVAEKPQAKKEEKPAPKAEPKEEKPTTGVPQEGSRTELPPQSKYTTEPRRMVFKDGEWKQEVGGQIVSVGEPVQKQAQEAFSGKTEAKAEETKPSAFKPNPNATYYISKGADEVFYTLREIAGDDLDVHVMNLSKDLADSKQKAKELVGEDVEFDEASLGRDYKKIKANKTGKGQKLAQRQEGEGAGMNTLSFGKYNGKTIDEVFEIDKPYILYLNKEYSNNTVFQKGVRDNPKIKEFIDQSLAEKENELKRREALSEIGGVKFDEKGVAKGVPIKGKIKYINNRMGPQGFYKVYIVDTEYGVPVEVSGAIEGFADGKLEQGTELSFTGNVQKVGDKFKVIGKKSEYKETKPAPKAPETKPAETKPQAESFVNDLEKALNAMKVKVGKGAALEGTFMIPVLVYNGAIDAAILAVKAGKTVVDAINVAVKYVNDNLKGDWDNGGFIGKLSVDLTKPMESYEDYKRVKGKGKEPSPGQKVGVRFNLNIQDYGRRNVLSVHEKNYNGEVIDIVKSSTVSDVKFSASKSGASKIKEGLSNKFPIASVDGSFVSSDADKTLTESGQRVFFNPKIADFFYDKDGREVLSASKATLDGSKVFADGLEYGERVAPINQQPATTTQPSFTSKQEGNASTEFDGIKKPSKIKTKSFDNKYGKGAFERMQNITQNFEDIMDGLSEKIKQDCL